MTRIMSRVSSGESQDQHLSSMTEHDLLEVVEIEEACGLSRWGWDAYHGELKTESSRLMFVVREESSGVSLSGRRLKGFIAARLIADELHINNVAVREEYRRQGIGRLLLKRVLIEGERMGGHQAFLEVRAGNAAAKALYTRVGFQPAGRRKGYYSEPSEDAIVMSRTLSDAA